MFSLVYIRSGTISTLNQNEHSNSIILKKKKQDQRISQYFLFSLYPCLLACPHTHAHTAKMYEETGEETQGVVVKYPSAI